MNKKINMKKLFLSSSFSDVVKLFKSFAEEDVTGKTVTFIPTASIHDKQFSGDISDRNRNKNKNRRIT